MSSQSSVFAGVVLCPATTATSVKASLAQSVSQAWDSMLARQTQYVVVVDPAKYSTPPQVFNQALSRENFPRVLRKLETSELFTQEPTLAEDTGILIFRRVDGVLTLFDYINRGRALSDRGLHEQAVADLQEATVLGPSNVEAWAPT